MWSEIYCLNLNAPCWSPTNSGVNVCWWKQGIFEDLQEKTRQQTEKKKKENTGAKRVGNDCWYGLKGSSGLTHKLGSWKSIDADGHAAHSYRVRIPLSGCCFPLLYIFHNKAVEYMDMKCYLRWRHNWIP